jgi:hypothetical protein
MSSHLAKGKLQSTKQQLHNFSINEEDDFATHYEVSYQHCLKVDTLRVLVILLLELC